MRFYETIVIKLPVEISESELKNIALDYNQYLKENNFEDNVEEFIDYYYDDTSNEYFYDFLFLHNIDFDLKNQDTVNIYNEIKKYM